jgi:hypothetical protein
MIHLLVQQALLISFGYSDLLHLPCVHVSSSRVCLVALVKLKITNAGFS